MTAENRVSLKDDFYRDGYYKALTAIAVLLLAIILLICTSLYLLLAKPLPVTFATGDEFRIVAPVPVSQPYLSQPDLIQWVSDTVPKVFTLDFVNYNQQLQNMAPYFTVNGWKNFGDILKIYADPNTVSANRLFISANPAGAPVIVNEGLLPGQQDYAWLIQMPLNLGYSSVNKGNSMPLIIQVLVVRVPTLNNLMGVAIEKMTITKGTGDQIVSNG